MYIYSICVYNIIYRERQRERKRERERARGTQREMRLWRGALVRLGNMTTTYACL